MKNDINIIRDKVIEIFEQRLQVNLKNYKDNYCDEEIFGQYMRFNASDMLYVYFDIEKDFKIEIPEEAIINGSFSTINNIVNIIYKQILMKSA